MLGGEWRGLDLGMDWVGVSDRMAYHAYGYGLCRTGLCAARGSVSGACAWAGRMTMSRVSEARSSAGWKSSERDLWVDCVSSHVFDITTLLNDLLTEAAAESAPHAFNHTVRTRHPTHVYLSRTRMTSCQQNTHAT